MVGWLKFNINEKIPFMVYLEIQCITFKMEKSFIAHPWIQRSVVGLEEYSAHDWRAATSGTARSSYLARVGPVVVLYQFLAKMVHTERQWDYFYRAHLIIWFTKKSMNEKK